MIPSSGKRGGACSVRDYGTTRPRDYGLLNKENPNGFQAGVKAAKLRGDSNGEISTTDFADFTDCRKKSVLSVSSVLEVLGCGPPIPPCVFRASAVPRSNKSPRYGCNLSMDSAKRARSASLTHHQHSG